MVILLNHKVTPDCEGMPPLEDNDGDELAILVEKSVVIKQTIQVQVKKDETNQQRENIFHTRCYVQTKVCSLIIDSESCVNVCSTTLVRKLNLCTIKHAKPYRLQWLSDSGEVKVTKQVVVPFFIRKYVDEVLCDVALMQTSHILLGRPWQYDRNVIHDGVKNRYTIVKDGKTITFIPLTPKQVYDDQITLKSEHEPIRRENQGEEQRERRPSNSVKTQNTTTTHSATLANTNKYSTNTPNNSDHLSTLPNTNKFSTNTSNKSDHSATTQKHLNLVKSGVKTKE